MLLDARSPRPRRSFWEWCGDLIMGETFNPLNPVFWLALTIVGTMLNVLFVLGMFTVAVYIVKYVFAH